MYHFEKIIILLAVLMALAHAQQIQLGVRPCPIALIRDCTPEKDITWAIDNENCFAFSSDCEYRNDNCRRNNRDKKTLSIVTKEECQKYCHDDCPKEANPVCAELDGQKRTFNNECELSAHICKTNETYFVSASGECK